MRVAIVGCGLIGGSLLRALLQSGGIELVAVDSDAVTRQRITTELRVAVHPSIDDVGVADVLVLALPVPVLLPAISNTPASVVTDVAGIKSPVLSAARAAGLAHRFVGAHPMAGKELGGFAQSDARLFEGKVVAICRETDTSEESVTTVADLWRRTGATVVECTAAEHDAAVARVSHLPHLVAAALARVAGRGTALSDRLAASGLRDTTRVAEDATVRFAAILNPALPGLAREAAAELCALADAIEAGKSVDGLLDEAAATRRRLYPR